jgi:hypothetical protein
MLRYRKLRVKHDLKKLMLIILDNDIKRSNSDIWTPICSHLGNFILSFNSSLQKLLVSCYSCSNNISIVASYTTIDEKVILGMLFVDILIN